MPEIADPDDVHHPPPRPGRSRMTARIWTAIGADWDEDQILDEFKDRPDIAWRVRVEDDIRLVGYLILCKKSRRRGKI